MATEMVVIRDLVTLQDFFTHAVRTLGGIDVFQPISVGSDGVQELGHLFEQVIRPDQLICTYQVAETPIFDNSAGLTMATFCCTIMILKKTIGPVQTPEVKLNARNDTWKKAIRLVGLIRLASEWYATNVNEINGEAYEVTFKIFQDKMLPVGKIANANVQGWLVDIDVSIPVNGLMYV
jgi:hypothetical protein